MLWKPGIIKLHQQPKERACTMIRIQTSYYVANAMNIVYKYRCFIRIIHEKNSLPDHVEVKTWTKAVETLLEKDLFRWTREFFNLSFSHFECLSPFQCCNYVTVCTEHISTLKREEGSLAIDRKDLFWNYGRTPSKKRLFCSNVSTLLSMIAGGIWAKWPIRPEVISVSVA